MAALTAVDGLDLRVETGSLHGLIGPNGAGKTSVFNAISGLVRGRRRDPAPGRADRASFARRAGAARDSRAPSRNLGCFPR